MRLSPSVLVVVCLVLVLSAMSADARVGFSRVGYSADVLYDGGERGQWIVGQTYTESELSKISSGLHFQLNLRYSVPNGDIHWGKYPRELLTEGTPDDIPHDGTFSGRIRCQEPYLHSTLSISPQRDWTSLTLNWRLRDTEDDLSAEISLKPTRFFVWSVARSLTHPLPSEADLYYDYENSEGDLTREGGVLRFNAPSWSTRIAAKVQWPGCLTIASSLEEADFRPSVPTANDIQIDAGFVGVIEGTWKRGRISGEYFLRPDRSLCVSYDRLEVDARFRAFDGGNVFAHFGVATLEAKLWSCALVFKRWRSAVNVAKVKGEFDGVVEPWPFLGGLARFLGERRHFMCQGDVAVKHAAIHTPEQHLLGVPISLRADGVHITPDLKYVSWRPVLFGFGVDDLKAEQFEIISADLIRLTIMPSLKWKSLRFETEISQWIPLAVERLEEASVPASSTPSPDPSEPTAEESASAWGGFSASVRLTRHF